MAFDAVLLADPELVYDDVGEAVRWLTQVIGFKTVVDGALTDDPFDVVAVEHGGEDGEADVPAGSETPALTAFIEAVLEYQAGAALHRLERPPQQMLAPSVDELERLVGGHLSGCGRTWTA